MPSTSTLDDSPRKTPSACSPRDGERTTLQKHCETFIENLKNRVVVCEADSWVEQYTAHNRAETVEHVKNALIAAKVYNTGDDRGWAPMQKAMSKRLSKNDAFAELGVIATHIAIAAQAHDSGLQFISTSVLSQQDKTLPKVDGFTFYPNWRTVARFPKGELPYPERRRTSIRLRKEGYLDPYKDWKDHSKADADTAMICMFNLHDTPQNRADNETEIISTASYLLYNDPRRSSVTGMTIEGSKLRSWHFNRSYVARSVAINIDQKPEALISLLLFAMTASLAQLGFDESVKRVVKDGGTVCYEMKVKDRWFQTVGSPISEDAAYAIVGRATRVWRVREKLGDELREDEWALKDCWISRDSATERTIQGNIFEKLSKDEREDAQRYFLTYEEDDVIEHFDELKLTPTARSKSGQFTNPTPEYRNSQASGRSSRQASLDAAGSWPAPPAPVELEHTRKNVRDVKKEVCLSIYELNDFKSLCRCLSGVTMALSYMFKAGYVHRDVSAGNSLFYEGRGILADVEYAKQYGEISGSDPKTGTPDFMAVEYQSKSYLFFASPPKKKRSLAEKYTNPGPGPDRTVTFIDRTITFIPHFVHDLESVIWQYLWFLHYRIPCVLAERKRSPELLRTLSNISASATRLFSHGIHGDTEREHFMTVDEEVSARPSLEATFVLINGIHLLEPYTLIEELRSEYKRIEKCDTEFIDNGRRRYPSTAFSDAIHEAFRSQFETASDWADKNGNVPVEDLITASNRLREQRAMPAPPSPTSARGSQASGPTPSSIPADNSRGSNKKRSRQDAQHDDEEEEQEQRARRGKKRKSEEDQQRGSAYELRSASSSAGVSTRRPKESREQQNHQAGSSRKLRSDSAAEANSASTPSSTSKTARNAAASGSGKKTRGTKRR